MRSISKSRPAAFAAAAATLLLATTSCSTTSQSVGIEDVDSLVSRVERVHLEVELSKQAVYNTLVSLGPLMAKKFEGDPAAAVTLFATTTEECAAQAEALRAQIKPMRASADTVFKKWSDSLDDFQSPRMKERSQRRFDATRERFAEVHEGATASMADLDALNVRFQDMVLYLGHDFNGAAVEEVRADAYEIRDESRALGKTFDDCMDAAAIYVEKSALRGQVETTVTDSEAVAGSAQGTDASK